MDIMELGALGELVGALAVVGSLVYVGRQVRQNAEQTRQSNAIERAQAAREITRDFNPLALALSGAEEMQLLRDGMTSFETLSYNDQARLHFLLSMRVTHAASILLAARDGLVDEGFARGWIHALAAWVATPGLGAWWQASRSVFHEGVVAGIEEALAELHVMPATEAYAWFGPDPSTDGGA